VKLVEAFGKVRRFTIANGSWRASLRRRFGETDFALGNSLDAGAEGALDVARRSRAKSGWVSGTEFATG